LDINACNFERRLREYHQKKLSVMKAKWISILAAAISSYLFFSPITGQAQWSLSMEYNMAFPVTSYKEAFATGSNFNLDGKYHFNTGCGIGFQAGAARFATSKGGSLAAYDSKLTVVPLIFTAEYEASRKGMIRPFFAAGLGLSIYTFSLYLRYHGLSTNVTNTSFTISPQVGLRFFFTKNLISYLKGSCVFVMDEQPTFSAPNLPVIIFPMSDKATGYAGIALGVSYRFASTNE
jgi:hypothetical protein